MAHYEIKDSGQRRVFETGAVRDLAIGKGRFDLISPVVEDRLAHHFEGGIEKYGERNWEKGIPIGKYIDSAKRHLNKWMRGMRDEDHLIAAVWNLHCLIQTVEWIKEGRLPRSLDDNHYLNADAGMPATLMGLPIEITEPSEDEEEGGRHIDPKNHPDCPICRLVLMNTGEKEYQ